MINERVEETKEKDDDESKFLEELSNKYNEIGEFLHNLRIEHQNIIRKHKDSLKKKREELLSEFKKQNPNIDEKFISQKTINLFYELLNDNVFCTLEDDWYLRLLNDDEEGL